MNTKNPLLNSLDDFSQVGGLTIENFLESRKALRRRKSIHLCTIMNAEDAKILGEWWSPIREDGILVGCRTTISEHMPPGTMFHVGWNVATGDSDVATARFYKRG